MTEPSAQTTRPAPETCDVASRRVACDGGKLGHPRVYLTIGEAGYVDCPYCDCRFTYTATAHDHA